MLGDSTHYVICRADIISIIRFTLKNINVKHTEDGGDRGIRTPDLRIANAALSQLSYIPSLTRQIIAQLILVSQHYYCYTEWVHPKINRL
jgi:hypothetical protein